MHEFTFGLGQWVETPFGTKGYVTTLAIDEGDVYKCRVRTKSKAEWFLETELKPLPTQAELRIGEGEDD